MKLSVLFLFALNLIFICCSENKNNPSKIIGESKIQEIGLQGDITIAKSEISGLTWYKDYLILLPQYPDRFNNHFFALPKLEIENYLSGTNKKAITPLIIPVITNDLEKNIAGFEGFEAIVFKGDSLYVSLESETDEKICAFIARGQIKPDLSVIEIFANPLGKVISRSGANNMSEETLVMFRNKLMTIHEANGLKLNPEPKGILFNLSLNKDSVLVFPNTEYRITDATEVDESGKFWAINYMYPGDKKYLFPGVDALAEKHGKGATHLQSDAVERLIEFQYTSGGIKHSGTAPIYLELGIDKDSRNWEGLVRLDDKGFLIVTDRFPGTILAFVPYHKTLQK